MNEGKPEQFLTDDPARTQRNLRILDEAGRRITTTHCAESVVLDFDAVNCHRRSGHDGMHEMTGEGGDIRWERA